MIGSSYDLPVRLSIMVIVSAMTHLRFVDVKGAFDERIACHLGRPGKRLWQLGLARIAQGSNVISCLRTGQKGRKPCRTGDPENRGGKPCRNCVQELRAGTACRTTCRNYVQERRA